MRKLAHPFRLLSFALTLSLLLQNGVLAVDWFDDFNDGDATDGMPETWFFNELGLTPGIYDASSGDFILSSPAGPTFDDDTLVASVATDFTTTYARTQGFILPGTTPEEIGGNVGLGVRFDPDTFSGYVAVLDHGALLTVVRSDMGNLTPLDTPILAVDGLTDFNIEMEAIGSQINTYVWRPGEARPTSPVSSVVDSTYSSGRAAIVYNEDDNNTAGVYRFATAQDAPFDTLSCDFDGDTRCDLTDIDMLTMEVATAGTRPLFDLNGDTQINLADVDQWLSEAATENGFGSPYKSGDADLDGVVDVSDFNIWNASKFSVTGKWSMGDFNADGSTDVPDFNIWNGNKFTSSDETLAVPEPATGILLSLITLALMGAARRRR